jgi:hypothetical protein
MMRALGRCSVSFDDGSISNFSLDKIKVRMGFPLDLFLSGLSSIKAALFFSRSLTQMMTLNLGRANGLGGNSMTRRRQLQAPLTKKPKSRGVLLGPQHLPINQAKTLSQ